MKKIYKSIFKCNLQEGNYCKFNSDICVDFGAYE